MPGWFEADQAEKLGTRALEITRGVANRGLEEIRRDEETKRRIAQDAEKLRRRNLEPPIEVAQDKTWHCWAAGSSSWVEAVYGRNLPKNHFIRKYANAADGGMDPLEPDPRRGSQRYSAAFKKLAADIGMKYEQLPGHQILPDVIGDKLERYGYLLLFYPLGGGVAHTVVVYGINYPGPGPVELSVMNPSSASLQRRPIGEFQSKNLVILGWNETGAR